MMRAKIVDTITEQLSEALPSGLKSLGQDVEKNVRAAVQGALAKLNLVTREEFDAQVKVLEHAHQRVAELEDVVRQLEAQLNTPKNTNESN